MIMNNLILNYPKYFKIIPYFYTYKLFSTFYNIIYKTRNREIFRKFSEIF